MTPEPPPPVPPAVARRQDLLLTLSMVGIAMTPAWLLPRWLAVPWMISGAILAPPAIWVSWRSSPWLPTPAAEWDRIVRHLALRPGQRFCDLGAGDGRFVRWVNAATGADATGLELSLAPYLVGRLRLALTGGPGTRMVLGDWYAHDLSGYDAVYVWGTAYSVGTERFGRHLRSSLRPGARIVSYHHPIPGLEPVSIDRDGQRPLFVYVVR